MEKKGLLHIVIVLLFLLNLPFGSLAKHVLQNDESHIRVVVIDPGHGGIDPGTTGGNIQEKDIVLKIALKLGDYIESSFPEIKVVYTRKTDVFIPLYRRADIANKADADLFISIHANAVDHRGVQGTETFVLGQHRSDDNLEVAKKENAVILLEDDYTGTYEGFDPNSPESYIMFELVQDEYKEQSISLANEIQNEFRVRALRKDRSVKEAGFLVLRQTTMPGVLIETGFLSNAAERNYLSSETGQDHLASAIFRAFKAYKADVEKKSSFHLVTEDLPPQALVRENTQPETTNTGSPTPSAKPSQDLFYSIQIMALKKKLDPTPANFNGLKNVFRVDDKRISRYFSGKYATLQEAEINLNLISSSFESAFIVAFQNNELISLKKLQEKQN